MDKNIWLTVLKIVLYVVERYLHSAYTQMNISVSLGGYKIKV